ncbi:translation initiation factor eIF-2 beta subunit [Tilletia horrida]|uniref:Translation initiation factor eIF-2 beta subunit n=1 Tax=Tilletia horrida TaxID=155126 RepID=A0AAN6JPX9_9BASI|nr:translation initiation factor eIF-2 beta subunit [Tilletia horrida]KAK0552317.1 translation initiation factor eIF-2 beta subunit [Tilletia horrida]KAK0561937.1 translation initiation factor eIF-2 beta subunit [Tilletia horrida]
MASEEPLFDPSLVKKKKKKVIIDLDDFESELKKSSPAPAAEESPAPAAKKADEGAAPAATPAAEGAGDAAADLDFGDLKKKTKKSKKKAFDLDAFEKELDGAEKDGGEADGAGAASKAAEDRDLGDDPFAREDGGADGDDTGADSKDAWAGSDRDYTYQDLLNRFFKTLRAQNPALSGDRKKYTIVPPDVQREGSKKTMFANLYDICKRLHRQPEHVLQYLFAELGTIGNLDGAQRLIIKGRFTQKQIEHVLRTYIVEYVTCKTCKSPNTLLTKENRIYFMTCESCGSQRSVSAIKQGFVAQTTRRIRTD